MADLDHNIVVPVTEHSSNGALIKGMGSYEAMYEKSINQGSDFWAEQANELLTWEKTFDRVLTGSFDKGNVRWFQGGKLNASYNCLDRHILEGNGDKACLIWEMDEKGSSKTYSYEDVLAETCKIANIMKKHGVRKGDAVTVYMPMVPEIVFVMLACARIGAPHSVVFAGFSAEALRERIVDCRSKFIFTCDEGKRGGRSIALKKCVDSSIDHRNCDFVEKVFVFKRTGESVPRHEKIDVQMEDEVEFAMPYCPPETMDAEDVLFYLYTSGSTGKPKGLCHTTAGYLVYTSITHKYTFDLRSSDVYACVADCGWITGHSYIVYGPLLNGATSVIFESTPLYPDHTRYWDLIQTHKVTQLYTAPTAIRALMRHGNECFKDFDLSTLRILGTVGEPINPEAWKWYFENVGSSRCAIVDTYWQTETGGFLITSLPGCTPMKPGSASKPFFGIQPEVLDPQTGVLAEKDENGETSGVLCIAKPWPGIARSVNNNHTRYMNTYLEAYKGYYFTGDGCTRDKDGYYWITGRVDDVLNVSGHRIGSAEVENALVGYDAVSEAAVIGIPHELKGQGIAVFVILKEKYKDMLDACAEAGEEVEDLKMMRQSLKNQVRAMIGPIATPDIIIFTNGLPKTRSGKIMRRVLRKIVLNETLGDISTLADTSVVEELQLRLKLAQHK